MRGSKYVTAWEMRGSKNYNPNAPDSALNHFSCSRTANRIFFIQSCTSNRAFLMQSRTSNSAFLLQHLFGFKIMQMSFLTLILNKNNFLMIGNDFFLHFLRGLWRKKVFAGGTFNKFDKKDLQDKHKQMRSLLWRKPVKSRYRCDWCRSGGATCQYWKYSRLPLIIRQMKIQTKTTTKYQFLGTLNFI